MKFTIVALCIIGYTFAAQGTPAGDSYCQGNMEGATTCSSCYNDGLNTSIGARQLASNACSTKVANTITGCKYYNSGITATKTVGDCLECNAMTWLNITGNASAASITMACSATSIDTTTNCTTAVASCAQSACYVAAGATAKAAVCRKCNSGFKGDGTLVTGVGYPSCTSTGIITNCSFANPILNTECFEAATGNCVSFDATGITAFTTDANCRQLGTGNTYCGQCKNGYYFVTTVCTLGAQLMAVSGLIMALFFFN